jgi:hypothetical protein
MKNVALAFTAAEADALLAKVKDGSIVTDNTVQSVSASSAKPVSSMAVAAALQAFTEAIQTTLTPSGAPMHYAYEAVGAVYNNTDTDKEVAAPWGDMVTHVARRWYLNGLGDITNEQMQVIYSEGWLSSAALPNFSFCYIKGRTNICRTEWMSSVPLVNVAVYNDNLEVLNLGSTRSPWRLTQMTAAIRSMGKLRVIMHTISEEYMTADNSYNYTGLSSLERVQITKLRWPKNFSASSKISKASVLYMIQNAAPTSAITITLHAEAYARLANDADIRAALAAQPLITLIRA